jgi:hypothetical protein
MHVMFDVGRLFTKQPDGENNKWVDHLSIYEKHAQKKGRNGEPFQGIADFSFFLVCRWEHCLVHRFPCMGPHFFGVHIKSDDTITVQDAVSPFVFVSTTHPPPLTSSSRSFGGVCVCGTDAARAN